MHFLISASQQPSKVGLSVSILWTRKVRLSGEGVLPPGSIVNQEQNWNSHLGVFESRAKFLPIVLISLPRVAPEIEVFSRVLSLACFCSLCPCPCRSSFTVFFSWRVYGIFSQNPSSDPLFQLFLSYLHLCAPQSPCRGGDDGLPIAP